jgi:hypothetical protein
LWPHYDGRKKTAGKEITFKLNTVLRKILQSDTPLPEYLEWYLTLLYSASSLRVPYSVSCCTAMETIFLPLTIAGSNSGAGTI